MPGSSLDRAVLEIDADIDGDGNTETGVFHMVGDLEIQQIVRPSPILGPELGNIASAIRRIITDGEANRKGAYVDIGAGRHAFEINFLGWEGAQDSEGNDLQWGNTGDPNNLTIGDATGADPLVQMQVFHRYIQVGVIDSFSPARLYVGEYADGTYGMNGLYSDAAPLGVILEINNGVRTTENPESYDGSITAVEAIDLSNIIDGGRQNAY
jgi:hypothetical protein